MPTAGKSTTKKATKAKPATKKAPAKIAGKTNVKVETTLASREGHFKRIQEEAYFLAEKDGFAGDPSSYWLAAESNVLRGCR